MPTTRQDFDRRIKYNRNGLSPKPPPDSRGLGLGEVIPLLRAYVGVRRWRYVGGRDAFIKKLDEFFNTPYNPEFPMRDLTGMLGQYVHGNETDRQVPYALVKGQ